MMTERYLKGHLVVSA